MYITNTIILKETKKGFSLTEKPLCAILKIEVDGNSCIVNLSAINIAFLESGNYFLHLLDNNLQLTEHNLGKTPLRTTLIVDVVPDLLKGIGAGITFIDDDGQSVVVAYGKTSNFNKDFYEFKKMVERLNIKASPSPIIYDDDIVATENYYLNNDAPILEPQLTKALPFLEEAPQPKDSTPYFDLVKTKLLALFDTYESFSQLNNTIPYSKWIKIPYSTTKFYVVGIIYEEDFKTPLYISYGVPGKYSVFKPPEFDDNCSFLPLSVFNPKGDGFWVMYQDAITGKAVILDE